MPLTDVEIRQAKRREAPYKLSDAGGLFLQITPSGSKLWRLKYRYAGREKLLSLGPYPDVSLSEARAHRESAKRALRAGKMTMGVIAAVAEFERDLLIERTQSGLKRAKAEGKVLGRRPALKADQQETIRQRRSAGVSLGVLAKEYGVSRSAIQRVERRAT